MASTRLVRTGLPWTVLTAAALGAAAQAGAQDVVGEDPPRAFQVYDSPAVRDRVESARGHIAAERWSEALVDLQALLEEHRGQVLGTERPGLPGERGTSVHPIHRGASEWATSTLAELPGVARELYRSRHGAQAARGLDAALRRADVAALAGVARRFPLTREAVRAWWAVGDLEVERGDVEVGLAAWARGLSGLLDGQEVDPTRAEDWRAALERLAERGEDTPGIAARVETAVGRLEERGELARLATRDQTTSALEQGADLGPLGPDPDSWPRAFDLPDQATNPFADPDGRFGLFPARAGYTLYVSTSRAVLAVGALTGELVWRTPEDFLGWTRVHDLRIDDFEKAIAHDASLIRPAVDRGTVVAALQIPFAFEDADNYGELEIIKVIPERRLFAFDAETGELLWDSRPPAGWDGESGDFSESTTVVGSPVIEGSRVLVPVARLRGRIELFVACYDLETGALDWRTPVLTGQRPLNMFGRLVQEYVAPPVVVAGDRIVVQSQLGTVACLDLFTGVTLWHATYDHIVFTEGNYYTEGQLNSEWRNAPPAVVGSTVVAAPIDSHGIIGVDLESGAVLWDLPYRSRRGVDVHGLTRIGAISRAKQVDVLLGADENRVYLGGLRVVALEAPGGLAREAPRRRAWAYPAGSDDVIGWPAPRPVLGQERVYVPRPDRLVILDRASGRRVGDLPWNKRDEGNLLISRGMLFTLSGYDLAGFFDWRAMVERGRARLAEAPDDPDRIGDLALLLHKRGLSELAAGDYRRARRHLEDAREEIGDHHERHPALADLRHRVLRAEARNLKLAGDEREALRRLRAARPLAPDRAARRDTLLEEQAVLHPIVPIAGGASRDMQQWLEVLELLDREYPDEVVHFLTRRPAGDEPGWRGPILPVVAAAEPEASLQTLELPVGLWVRVERARAFARRRLAGDAERALSDLHAILARYPGRALRDGLAARDWASQEIAAWLENGPPDAYRAFEEAATERLERAVAEGDLDLLERVPELYPHSRAAERSNDFRIELALEEGDVNRVAEIALDEIPDRWSPRAADEREVRHLVRLAHLLGESGNLELRAALSRRLAEHHPDVTVTLPDAPATSLVELADAWALPAREEVAPPTFGADLEVVWSRPRQLVKQHQQPVGVVPPGPGQREPLQLMCDGSDLHAHADEAPARGESPYRWERSFDSHRLRGGEHLPADFEQVIATTPGRVHVATRQRVLTLDGATGEELWSWISSPFRTPAVLRVSDGVVLVVEDADHPRGSRDHFVTALDAASGVELWNMPVSSDHFERDPIVGGGCLVLLPNKASRADVFDLFTGGNQASFELDYLDKRTHRAAWIEHGRIILPYLLGRAPDGNHVLAYDLETGRRAWRVPLDGLEDQDLAIRNVLSYGGRHFLYLYPEDTRDKTASVYELDTRLGALATRPIARLLPGHEEAPLGIGSGQHVRLASPYLFLLGSSRRDEPRWEVRAVHLRYGERWRVPLPPDFAPTHAGDLPQPVVSDSTVALGMLLRVSRTGRKAARVLVLERASGRELRSVDLEEAITRNFTLSALGDSLLVSRTQHLDLLR